jgi:hypothetical protein
LSRIDLPQQLPAPPDRAGLDPLRHRHGVLSSDCQASRLVERETVAVRIPAGGIEQTSAPLVPFVIRTAHRARPKFFVRA